MSLSRIVGHGFAAISASLLTLLVQVTAIVVLSPHAYGAFALMYMGLGLGSAVVYSVVAEAWARGSVSADDWGSYSGALLGVSGVAAIFVLLIGGVIGAPIIGAVSGLAVAMTLYRTGARFFVLAVDPGARVNAPDLVAAAVFVVAMPLGWFALDSITALVVSWSLAAVAAAVMSVHPRWAMWHTLPRWVRERGGSARALIADSALLELGSTGVPLLLTPFMGLAQFGTYRSVTSAAVPVRLLVNPLRPNISRLPVSRLLSTRLLLAIGAISVMLGSLVGFGLHTISTLDLIPSSTLNGLALYSLPVGMFVATNFASTVFYVSLRTKASSRMLVFYRCIQLAATVVASVGGFIIWGLGGAVWGYFAVSACMLTVSIAILKLSRGSIQGR